MDGTMTLPRTSLGRFIKGFNYNPRGIPKEKRTCQVCGSEFYKWPSQLKAARIICSRECYFKSKIGEKQKQLLDEKGKCKKNIAGKISNALTGRPQPWNKNEKHHEWKGDRASYFAFHAWLIRHFGRASKCENPNCYYPRKNKQGKILKSPKTFQWALIHGFEHDHERTHYMQLCPSCHVRYDQGTIEI